MEAPDDEAASKYLRSLASGGNLRTTTLKAMSERSYREHRFAKLNLGGRKSLPKKRASLWFGRSAEYGSRQRKASCHFATRVPPGRRRKRHCSHAHTLGRRRGAGVCRARDAAGTASLEPRRHRRRTH